MAKIAPPSGFRDFSPKETLLRQALIQHIGSIYQRYGFQPIQVAELENIEVLLGKGGGTDNEKLIFKVLRRGEDLKRKMEEQKWDEIADMGLRFDLTLPLARYYAGRRHQLPKPFKVYHMAPVWRADRPQKGRYREFYQCDVDIIGCQQVGAELECMGAIADVFLFLGLKGVRFLLNDRRLLTALGTKLGVTPEIWHKVLIALDKLDKIGVEGVRVEVATLLPSGAMDEFSRLLLSENSSLNEWRDLEGEAVDSLSQILSLLKATQPELQVEFSPRLVRGQDYYTGTVFEVMHPALSGSLGGGGRYDRLLELFEGEAVPSFGGSIGFERLALILEETGGLAGVELNPQVFLPLLNENLREFQSKLARSLRMKGIRVDVFPESAKLKNQFKYADERQIPYTILIGEEEYARGTAKIKHMLTRTEEEISQKDLIERMEKLCLT